jgi:hypothetical protein
MASADVMAITKRSIALNRRARCPLRPLRGLLVRYSPEGAAMVPPFSFLESRRFPFPAIPLAHPLERLLNWRRSPQNSPKEE